MKTLDINQQEQELLTQVLDRCLMDLDHEIHHTDNGGFKQRLRQRQIIIASIMRKLPSRREHAGTA